MYIAEKEFGMNIPEKVAEKVLARIKKSFSQEGRRSAYTPSELKEIIIEIEGADVLGANDNRKDSGKRLSQE